MYTYFLSYKTPLFIISTLMMRRIDSICSWELHLRRGEPNLLKSKCQTLLLANSTAEQHFLLRLHRHKILWWLLVAFGTLWWLAWKYWAYIQIKSDWGMDKKWDKSQPSTRKGLYHHLTSWWAFSSQRCQGQRQEGSRSQHQEFPRTNMMQSPYCFHHRN